MEGGGGGGGGGAYFFKRNIGYLGQTLELFQRQHGGNFWEMGRSAYGLFQAQIYTIVN